MNIRLTETVTKGGCAAKLPAGQLRKILGQLALKNPPELIVGTETLDDACLWDLGNGQLLIQTLDFFTPIVDDPKDFGRIAAANALSDVFAMGGAPKTAMTILAFPAQQLDLGLLEPLMTGAVEKIIEAGACLAGGHSIDDDTLKLGFSVSGFVKKEKAWKNSGAQAGDVLILTKALGTGTITSAIKNKKSKTDWEEAAIHSMCQLNRVPELVSDFSIHAATDITGFGLLGHALQLAQASGRQIEFQSEALPVILGARDCLEGKILNRAHRTNWDYVEKHVQVDCKEEWKKWLTVDPQTSGGLLLSVSASDASEILKRVRTQFSKAAIVGGVKNETPSGKRVVLI
ncbi:selenide, water dikinase SelD [bacterium]|nr:selenide, water dikinase SelD [bacterium]NBX83603.1 selenide, water dikinase SelD [bacterium]